MKLILTEDIQTLGTIGDVVKVKDGYARNYLLPRSLAVVANEGNQKEFEHRRRVLAAKRKKAIDAFTTMAKKIERTKITIEKQIGEDERIFGSVTTNEITDLLAKSDIAVAKRDVKIVGDVKKTGKYVAEIKLHPEVTAKLNFKVAAQKQEK